MQEKDRPLNEQAATSRDQQREIAELREPVQTASVGRIALKQDGLMNDNGRVLISTNALRGVNMTRKNWTKCLTGAALFGFAVRVLAAPYAITYSDTTSSAVPAAGINSGELATIKLILDNGNSSAANQTWTAADAKCVVFTFNNAQNLFVAINYSSVTFPETVGTYTTNGSGVLQTAASDWADTSDPVLGVVSTNISGSTPVAEWFIDGENQVMDLNNGVVFFTNVVNNIIPADWTNPAPDSGVCGSAPPPPPQVRQPIPALGDWAMVLLSGLLFAGGVFALRRKRQ